MSDILPIYNFTCYTYTYYIQYYIYCIHEFNRLLPVASVSVVYRANDSRLHRKYTSGSCFEVRAFTMNETLKTDFIPHIHTFILVFDYLYYIQTLVCCEACCMQMFSCDCHPHISTHNQLKVIDTKRMNNEHRLI